MNRNDKILRRLLMHVLHRFLTNSSMRAVHTYMYTLFICTRTHNQMEALPNDHACLLYYMYTHFPLCFFFVFVIGIGVQEYIIHQEYILAFQDKQRTYM